MNKIFKMIFPVFWMIILLLTGLYYVFFANHAPEYSESENRMLAGVPRIADSVSNGCLDSDVESYLLDRFPNRENVIAYANSFRDWMSISTYEDYLLVNESMVDPLDSGLQDDNIEALMAEVLNQQAVSEDTALATVSEDAVSENEIVLAEEVGENPPIEQKPVANLDDYGTWLNNYMVVDDKTTVFSSYSRDSVIAMVAVLNKYAGVLPEDGKLMVTIVPQATYANQFVNSNHNGYMFQDSIDIINAFSANNVYAFDAAYILSEHIAAGEYIFFRTDMHWTPLGSYYLYKEMVEQSGNEAADYYNDYIHSTEDPFLGTYYRDNPSQYLANNADILELLEPPFPHELRRINGKDSYYVIPYLDENAKANDRYTVYLGGPAGPWTYVECDNGKEENCLVIMDSFGLGYFTFLTQNYKQVHYYDPRYFDASVVGYSVSEMIELYNIQDIYVILGDLHTFNSSFILENANIQF